MKNLLSLFRPSPKEQQLEEELNGKVTSTRQPSSTSTPPRRGASPASVTPGSADGSELSELRISLQTIESKLQIVSHERDSIRAEFQSYRQAVSQDQRSLEDENKRLRQSLDETGRMLSKQIAGSGLDGPLPGISSVNNNDGPKGLQRAIQAAKAEAASTTPLQRHEKIL